MTGDSSSEAPSKGRKLKLQTGQMPPWGATRPARGCSALQRAWLVCTQAAEGETMRLFLPLSSGTILTLRALMGWLPWEPELPSPSQGA